MLHNPQSAQVFILMGLIKIFSMGVAYSETLSGRIFEDLNENGILDVGEPGISGVRVSDGLDIAVTDQDGDYRLEIGDETVAFIVKPRGYRTPVNEHQIPQFYYIHQPNGSPPGLRYPGIHPTGPLPDSVNFPLVKQQEPETFEVVLFSDPQPQTEIEVGYIRDTVVTELIGTSAKFGMTMGDMMFGDLSLFPRYNGLIAQLGIPWYNVPGNHDMNLDVLSDRYSLETFKRLFGPPYYSFEYGEAVFVVLDSIQYQGIEKRELYPNERAYIANLGQRQLIWLENELAHVPRERLIILAMHAPLESYLETTLGVIEVDRRALFKLLEGRPNLFAVGGHTHTTEHHYFDAEDGFTGPGEFHQHILSVVSGSWWSGPFDSTGIPISDQRDGTPRGYHLLKVNGVSPSVRYKAQGRPDDYQMRILYDVSHHGHTVEGMRDFRMGELIDGRFDIDQVPAAEILVNLFDGGPKSVVEFRVGDGGYQPMERVIRLDPYVNEVYLRNSDTKKPWVNAMPSSHIFSADLPDNLTVGTHLVSVRATDEYGHIHHSHSVLEIIGN